MAAPVAGGVEAAEFLALSNRGPKAEKKRKRLNRNIKKNWGKHSDVRDVEEYLEDVRLQERTLGGLLSEKADDNLFFVDTGNDEQDARKNKRAKPLRIDLILQPDSRVAAPKDISSHQVPNGRKLKRRHERQKKLERKGFLPRAERLLRAQLKKTPGAPPQPNSHPGRGFYDIWAESNPLDSALEGKDSWFLQETKKSRVKRPDRLNAKPSQLPAVEVISSGASYNPTFESHQVLLLRAHEAELKKVKAEERIERQLRFPTAAEAPTEESRLQELCEGLVEESEEEEPAEEQEGQVTTALSQRERKTERQRRKERESRILRARLQVEKTLTQRRQELFQLRSIQSELKRRQGELAGRRARRLEKRKAAALLPRRLGRLKYQEPDAEIKLSEELAGSLRELKPEGSIAKDRFKSFQKRNLIEPRERAKFKRKLKVKYVEKRAFRDVTL